MSEQNHVECPGCGANLTTIAQAAFAPEILTIAYRMEPGRKMAVEDFCESLKALAKSLKLIAKELGQKVMVSVEDLKVSESEITASVSVIECGKVRK